LAALAEARRLVAENERLRGAVADQMVADVPLGAFLSGGIDSSLIVALMQAQSARPVKTFSIGFHAQDYDEAPYARAVARHLGTEHTELYVAAEDAQAVIPQLPTMYDEPFADCSQIPTFLVSALARQQVTVAMSGDGGDELFGGYSRYTVAAGLWRRQQGFPPALRRAMSAGLRAVSPARWDGLFSLLGPVLPASLRQPMAGDKLHKLARLLTVDDPLAMYLNDIATIPANLAGIPGMSVPNGLAFEDGLPSGVQILAPAMQDAQMYRVGSIIEHMYCAA
jgi:asparagine synthase (glutamine-hydrolysing)